MATAGPTVKWSLCDPHLPFLSSSWEPLLLPHWPELCIHPVVTKSTCLCLELELLADEVLVDTQLPNNPVFLVPTSDAIQLWPKGVHGELRAGDLSKWSRPRWHPLSYGFFLILGKTHPFLPKPFKQMFVYLPHLLSVLHVFLTLFSFSPLLFSLLSPSTFPSKSSPSPFSLPSLPPPSFTCFLVSYFAFCLAWSIFLCSVLSKST